MKSEFETILSNKNSEAKFSILQDTIDKSNDYEKIMFAANLFYGLAKEENIKLMISQGLLNISVAYWQFSDYIQTIRHLTKTVEYAKSINDTNTLITSYIYFGLVYGRIKDWSNVKKYLDLALKLSKLTNSHFDTASSFWNLAYYEAIQNNFEVALKYCDSAYYYIKKKNNKSEYLNKFGLGLIYYYKGTTNPRINQHDTAVYYLHKALKINTEIQNNYLISACYAKLALEFETINKLDSAIYYANKCLNFTEGTNLFEYRATSHESLFKTYEKIGNIPLAYHNFKLYKEMNDSVFRNDARVVAAKKELESTIKDFVIERKNEETQRNLIILIAIIVVATLVITTFLIYSRYKLKSKLSNQLAEINSTKDKFFSIISHDLKTPVASFNTLSSLINDYYNNLSDAEKLEQIKLLKESSGNILKLLDNLLIWARIQTGKISYNPEIINVNEIIHEEIELIKPTALYKSISFQFNPEENYFAFADFEMLSIVIRNLLSNAVKFTELNGEIKIEIAEQNVQLEISIIDNGIGIDENDFPKLFKIDTKHSTRGTNNEKGTGLGLNLCKEFIEINSGKIWLESSPNKGTKVKFNVLKIK